MKFATLKEALRLCAAAKVSAIIWGHRGIGKSDAVRQLCEEGLTPLSQRGKDFVPRSIGFVDFRCSQIEASDLRGLPDKKDGRTVYLPPAELPSGDLAYDVIDQILAECLDEEEKRVERLKLMQRYPDGILFLDEPNRAEDDVLQAIFQLILDRQIGQYILPAGWSIALAANYMEGDYITNGFTDSALLDRMCHLHLVAGEETLDDWCTFMARKHGEPANKFIQYCASNLDVLVGQPTGELGFRIEPSPRSWDRAATVYAVADEMGFGEDTKHIVLQGLVGMECAIQFEQYECPVQPRDLLNHGIEPYAKLLSELNRNQVMGVSWGLISLIRDKMDNRHNVGVALDLAEVLIESRKVADKDIVLAYIRALMTGNEDEVALTSCITNLELAGQIVKIAADANPLLKALFDRPKLHKRLSAVGWGNEA